MKIEDSPKSKRNRYRWLIVALVLAPFAWWHWPRGDARFVGKWTAQHLGDRPRWEWRLYSNGSMRKVSLRRNEPAETGTWRVQGNVFVMSLWMWPPRRPGKWDIEEIEQDRIVIQSHDNMVTFIELTRLPE